VIEKFSPREPLRQCIPDPDIVQIQACTNICKQTKICKNKLGSGATRGETICTFVYQKESFKFETSCQLQLNLVETILA
jgi:hypothetical protein